MKTYSKPPKVVMKPVGKKIFVPAPQKVMMARRPEDNLPPRDALLQSLFDAIVLTDPGGKIIDANMRAEELLGYTAEELRRTVIAEALRGLDEKALATLKRGAGEQNYGLTEAVCQRRDGTDMHLEIAVSIIRCETHPGFCYSLRDVTQRKTSEARLMTVYNAIANNANGIVVVSRDDLITFANPAFADMLGHAAADLVGADINDFIYDTGIMEHIHENVRSGMACSLQTALRNGDGQLVPVQVVASPDTSADGSVSGIVFSFENISERLRVEEIERRAAEQRLETERIQARMDTIRTLGYSINNPLQTLLSLVELEKRDDFRQPIERIMEILAELHQDHPLERTATENGESCYVLPQTQPQDRTQATQACDPQALLLADDEPTIQQLFSRIISTRYPLLHVDTVSDGNAALAAFQRRHHAVIVLDVAMPGMDGVTAGGEIIRYCEEKGHALPHIIFCSGFIPPEGARRIVGDGSHHGLLKKPIGAKDLLQALQKYLRDSQA